MSVLYTKYPIGCHLPFSGKLVDTVMIALNYGMKNIQFFMGSNKGFNRTKLDLEDLEKSQTIAKKYDIGIFTHFPYIANLTGSVKTLAWNGNIEQDRKTTNLLKNLEFELNTIAKLGLKKSGVVIHPGSYKETKAGIDAICTSINKINFEEGSKLLLENCAGEGSKIPKTLCDIKAIIDGIDEKKRKHIGVCLDTCHTFAHGEYNLSIGTEVTRLFTEFDELVGREYLSLIHLNDSETKLGSKRDLHECLGEGHIWKENFEALRIILGICEEREIPIVLETPNALKDKIMICGMK